MNRSLAVSMAGLSFLLNSCRTSQDTAGSGTLASVKTEQFACGEVIDSGSGDLDFKSICLSEQTGVATIGTREKTSYKYVITKNAELENTFDLTPVSDGNPLIVMFKLKSNYEFTTIIEALTKDGIELPDAGGRVWVINHPKKKYTGEDSGSYIAGNFKIIGP